MHSVARNYVLANTLVAVFPWLVCIGIALGQVENGLPSVLAAGLPLEFTLQPGEMRNLTLTGVPVPYLGVSIQQCSGDKEVRGKIVHLSGGGVGVFSRASCLGMRINGTGDVNEMCTFRNVKERGNYLVATTGPSGDLVVDPTRVVIFVANPGTQSASMKTILFSASLPSSDPAFSTGLVQPTRRTDGLGILASNVYRFRWSHQLAYCDENPCSLSVYYTKGATPEDPRPTACQAQAGTLALTAPYRDFQESACIELPAEDGAFRISAVVTPEGAGRSFAARFGLDDLLLFVSEVLDVKVGHTTTGGCFPGENIGGNISSALDGEGNSDGTGDEGNGEDLKPDEDSLDNGNQKAGVSGRSEGPWTTYAALVGLAVVRMGLVGLLFGGGWCCC